MRCCLYLRLSGQAVKAGLQVGVGGDVVAHLAVVEAAKPVVEAAKPAVKGKNSRKKRNRK